MRHVLSLHTAYCVPRTLYLAYIVFTLILMLNLLIAVLSDSFSDRKSSTVLHGRVAFARVVLRLELLADSFGIDTHGGDGQPDGRYVHEFRVVGKNIQGEDVPMCTSEDIFDDDGSSAELASGRDDDRLHQAELTQRLMSALAALEARDDATIAARVEGRVGRARNDYVERSRQAEAWAALRVAEIEAGIIPTHEPSSSSSPSRRPSSSPGRHRSPSRCCHGDAHPHPGEAQCGE